MMRISATSTVVSLAVQAARLAIRIRDLGLTIETKPDGSKVTNADLASHDVLRAGLESFYGGAQIISEEDKVKPTDGCYQNAWVVDPIDRTGAFIGRKNYWGILIARVENRKPEEGIAYYPELEKLYYTEDGGAYKCTLKMYDDAFELGPVEKLMTRHNTTPIIRYSPFKEAIGIRFPRGSQMIGYTQPSNSTAVLEGALDIAVTSSIMGDWDLAAPDALLRKAGGILVSAISGEPLQYGLRRYGDMACLQEESIGGNRETLARLRLIVNRRTQPTSGVA